MSPRATSRHRKRAQRLRDANILAAVRRHLDHSHLRSAQLRRAQSPHIWTEVVTRYWNEVLALESLHTGMTLAEMLGSEHALVREAAQLALGAS